MIRKLAEELALGDAVTGSNNIQPTSPTPPSEDGRGSFSEHTVGRAEDTRQGELGRAFTNFPKSVSDFRTAVSNALNTKVQDLSGSSAAAQAVARNKKAG